jgi:small subunit ribosomal protein S12e
MAEEIETVAPVIAKEEAAPAATDAAAAPAAGADATATPVAPAAVVPEPLNLRTAVQQVLKQALAHDGLARGLHECAKALDRGKAFLCLLAEDCDEPAYVKLVEALCAARQTTLIKVPEGTMLGEWAGLCKIDRTGQARRVVKCSCVVVKEIGKQTSPAFAFINNHLKTSGASFTV